MATQAMSGHMMHEHASAHSNAHHYVKFGLMIGLSFIAMYFLMFSMIDSASSFYNNINMFYMAGLMAAPMAIIEIVLMSKMYPNKQANVGIIVGSVLLLGFFWIGIRNQAAVGDNEFLRSMIPHHSGAILMCTKAQITNPEIKALCKTIVKSQQDEIDQMKAILSKIQ